MTAKRAAPLVVALVLAALVAVAGAAANLRLMGTRESTDDRVALTVVRPDTGSGSADDPTGGPAATDIPRPPVDSTVPPTTTVPAAPARPPDTDPAPGATNPAPVAPPPSAETTTTHVVGSAGTVTLAVRGTTISVISVRLANGWTSTTEHQSGDEVEVSFRRAADGAEASLRAQIEDGRLRVEIDDERAEPPDD